MLFKFDYKVWLYVIKPKASKYKAYNRFIILFTLYLFTREVFWIFLQQKFQKNFAQTLDFTGFVGILQLSIIITVLRISNGIYFIAHDYTFHVSSWQSTYYSCTFISYGRFSRPIINTTYGIIRASHVTIYAISIIITRFNTTYVTRTLTSCAVWVIIDCNCRGICSAVYFSFCVIVITVNFFTTFIP